MTPANATKWGNLLVGGLVPWDVYTVLMKATGIQQQSAPVRPYRSRQRQGALGGVSRHRGSELSWSAAAAH
jgi:hypothetical protein